MMNHKDPYRSAPFLIRALVKARPWICPFEPIMAHVPQGSRVLDVGCGVGFFLISLAQSGKIARGLGRDINAEAISVANEAVQEIGAPLRFEVPAGMHDWPDEQFDVVSLVDVLHHIPPAFQKDFLLKAASLVRPGGRLLYKDMAERPLLCAWTNRLHDLVLARQWIAYVPFDQVGVWLHDVGYVPHAADAWRIGLYAHEMGVWVRPE